MRAWLIQVGEPLPTDPGNPRLWRTGLLAEQLARRGHDVLWWASTFEHRTKQHRYTGQREVSVSDRLRLLLLRSPGYKGNISLGRLYDHRVLAASFREAVNHQLQPDVIHCGFPTIELSRDAVRYGRAHNVPVVLDVRDLWPDIFLDSIPAAMRPIARMAMRGEVARTREACAGATAITGPTPGFVEFGLRYAGRLARPMDRVFPFGYPATPPNAADVAAARTWWDEQGVRVDDPMPTICFLGTFGAQRALDFETVIDAARLLSERDVRVRFVLCGAGPRLEESRRRAEGLPNLILPGWVGFPQMWTLMRRSIVGLLPYFGSTAFAMHVPNKAIEYLSGSLPVLTSLTGGYLEDVLRSADCGVFYKGGDPGSLAGAVETLLGSADRLADLRSAAARLFEGQYAAERIYGSLSDYLEHVSGIQPCEAA
ncbi:MAG: glycosyltransferase family 4 protein [Vicinamibacterales bacterium]